MYALDTNILAYAAGAREPAKNALAQRLVEHALRSNAAFARQVLGELLSAAHRKPHISLIDSRALVEIIEATASVIDTDAEATLAASELAERHRLQYFDALICIIAQRGGASILFSEDMHDGLRLGMMTIVNPFAPANAAIVAAAIA